MYKIKDLWLKKKNGSKTTWMKNLKNFKKSIKNDYIHNKGYLLKLFIKSYWSTYFFKYSFFVSFNANSLLTPYII